MWQSFRFWLALGVLFLVVQLGYEAWRRYEPPGEGLRIVTSPPAWVQIERLTAAGRQRLDVGRSHKPFIRLGGAGDHFLLSRPGYETLVLPVYRTRGVSRYPPSGELKLQPEQWWHPLFDHPGLWLATVCAIAGFTLRRRQRLTEEHQENLQARLQLGHDARTGLLIGPYQVLRELGRGGMASVYEVSLQDRPQERRALKLLHANSSDEARQRYRREVRLSLPLRHPNLVAFYDFGEHGGRAYLVMELVDGTTLDNAWVQEPLRVRLGWLAQVADGVQALHDAGILHRDLKPANVMVTGQKALVMDFGIAKELEGVELSAAGQVAGTPGYMAPEQISSDPLDQRTDLYALGTMIYVAACGRLPYSGETTADLLSRQVTEEPEALAFHRPDLPADFCGWVMSLLSRDPALRPARATDIAATLRFWMDRLEPG